MEPIGGNIQWSLTKPQEPGPHWRGLEKEWLHEIIPFQDKNEKSEKGFCFVILGVQLYSSLMTEQLAAQSAPPGDNTPG
ncbi:hypothetical protein CRENBAI_008560 [Crenichthys baileyi]|uniref:Uncharacterized protein n=1 Tax=Crenichthys baileyi TaxID=28760 RepID=A0AAV9RFX8_9TELE